jgi:hypothetical protein
MFMKNWFVKVVVVFLVIYLFFLSFYYIQVVPTRENYQNTLIEFEKSLPVQPMESSFRDYTTPPRARLRE